jgi:transposase-like protein
MNVEIKARLRWVQLYEETGDAGFVCRRCGISRPTLRKWSKRYKELGMKDEMLLFEHCPHGRSPLLTSAHLREKQQ